MNAEIAVQMIVHHECEDKNVTINDTAVAKVSRQSTVTNCIYRYSYYLVSFMDLIYPHYSELNVIKCRKM